MVVRLRAGRRDEGTVVSKLSGRYRTIRRCVRIATRTLPSMRSRRGHRDPDILLASCVLVAAVGVMLMLLVLVIGSRPQRDLCVDGIDDVDCNNVRVLERAPVPEASQEGSGPKASPPPSLTSDDTFTSKDTFTSDDAFTSKDTFTSNDTFTSKD